MSYRLVTFVMRRHLTSSHQFMDILFKGYFKPGTIGKVSILFGDGIRFEKLIIGDIEVRIEPRDNIFVATIALEIDENTYDHLDNNKNLRDNKFIVEVQKKLRTVIEKIIRNLKYLYGIPELDDRNERIPLEELYTWSDRPDKWYVTRDSSDAVLQGSDLQYKIDNNFLIWIPSLIEDGIEPLFGFTHLHKAFLETNTRHQWIDATTAAELSIKEFLTIYKPELAPFLLHVPSPPIRKLYGEILRDYTGKASPMTNVLSKGADQRNLLIHRARQVAPTRNDTDIYLHQVQIAIMHLHTLMEPNSKLFEYLLKRSEDKLSLLVARIKQEAEPSKTKQSSGLFGDTLYN
jgi:hypothetical protein